MNTVLKGLQSEYAIDSDALFEVIRHSLCINRHMEFFVWLQAYVADYIPHDILVATWGDFSSNQLHYDVASNIPEVHTHQLVTGCQDIDPLMRNLHRAWKDNDNEWFVLSDFDRLNIQSEDKGPLMEGLAKTKSILVYGYRDHRGENDCLYAFFNNDKTFNVEEYLLKMLMPHVDAALRRVECLPATDQQVSANTAIEISDREHDVMNWVKSGKTNDEIAVILGISPNTVKNHLKNIFKKMQVCTRAQAVALYQAEIEQKTNVRGVINESVYSE